MEWVETTGKTLDEALERALDRLGVAEDDAEIEVVEEPRAGLFGLMRGEARVRARVRPTEVRPKQDRRRGRRSAKANGGADDAAPVETSTAVEADDAASSNDSPASSDGSSGDESVDATPATRGGGRNGGPGRSRGGRGGRGDQGGRDRQDDDGARNGRGDREDDDRVESEVDPAVVGAAAVEFIDGLVDAFGLEATTELLSDGVDLDVRVDGADVGLLIGPGGRTLTAIQDLARVAAQRRLGDHETRLRIDVAGYRERRRAALEKFTRSVAQQVIDSGRAVSMEPMPSADRKIVHDVINELDGVASRSDGDDPYRRVVVVPA